MLAFFAIGGVGLLIFSLIELFVARDPLLDLRLFKRPVFLNATVVGYVSVVALFGAEFLLPLYLQTLRGKSALETGVILLPLALSSGVVVPLAGKLYDKVGARPLMVVGFGLLAINTWQFSLSRRYIHRLDSRADGDSWCRARADGTDDGRRVALGCDQARVFAGVFALERDATGGAVDWRRGAGDDPGDRAVIPDQAVSEYRPGSATKLRLNAHRALSAVARVDPDDWRSWRQPTSATVGGAAPGGLPAEYQGLRKCLQADLLLCPTGDGAGGAASWLAVQMGGPHVTG